MKLKDIKPGMFVVCKEKPHFDRYYYGLSWVHDSIIGKKLKAIRVDSDTKTVNCNVLDNNLNFWFKPEWLSPWEEQPKENTTKYYYQGIDVTGLDYDIVARMAEDNNDLCSSKIFNTIAKLNRCKQVTPKTAKLVDKLIKELVDILDLHEHEEKKDNRPLNNQIEILKEENEKLKKDIELLQKKKNNSVKINKTCENCKYYTTPVHSLPCDICSTHSHWQPPITDIINEVRSNKCTDCRYNSFSITEHPCSSCAYNPYLYFFQK